MATDFSFSRRSLISNEQKYRQSLEYRMFMAENPDFSKNQTAPVQPPSAQDNINAVRNSPYDLLPEGSSGELQFQQSPALSNTLDQIPQNRLLNRERQFVQYAPDFRKPGLYDQYQVPGQLEQQQPYVSQPLTKALTMDSRGQRPAAGKSTSTRVSRWEPKTPGNAYRDNSEINDRASLFSGNDFSSNQQQKQAYGRQALSSVRPSEQPKSALISSAKIQMGAQHQLPSATLHNTSSVIPENPLIGFSEGDRQRKLYQQEFLKHAFSQAPGSINDVKERSRSKSRRARLEAQRLAQEREQAGEESIVDIMYRTKAASYPNRLAQKQRYAYSRAASNSVDLTRDGEQSIDLNQSIQPGQINAGTYQVGQRTLAPQSPARPPALNDIGSELSIPPDLMEREQKKADYKATLEAQINEKNEKKRLAKQKEADEEVRFMNDYANHYHFGALRQGGGSPVRDRNGEIISQHIPFSSQSQHNGGVEEGGYQPKQAPAQISSYGQQFGTTADPQQLNDSIGRETLSATYSPKKQEIQHMKPSNMFEDITEAEFNKREQEKKAYQNELFQQMQEAQDKKKMEKERARRQEIEDDKKIHAALDQMREAFRKEEGGGLNQTNDASQFERDSTQQDISGIQNQNNDYSNFSPQNESMNRPPIPEYAPMQINVEPDYYGGGGGPPSPRFDTRVNAHDEQLQRLKKVQEEIEAKANQDRAETNKIFKDLIDSTNRMNYSLHRNNSPFNIRNNVPLPQSNTSSRVSPTAFQLDRSVSGNIRLESNFTRVPQVNRVQGVSPSPIQRVEQSADAGSHTDVTEIGGPSRSVADITENKSAIGRLDDLIEDFSKPVSNQGLQ